MERRNRSLKALSELQYIDTLDDEIRAKSLENWVEKYLQNQDFLHDLDLSTDELEKFAELFYKNINFLKKQKDKIQNQLQENQKIQKFFN